MQNKMILLSFRPIGKIGHFIIGYFLNDYKQIPRENKNKLEFLVLHFVISANSY